MWKRGKNIKYIVRKLRQAIEEVIAWALEWGFRLTVPKTKVMFFTKKKVGNNTKIKLYGVDSFKY